MLRGGNRWNEARRARSAYRNRNDPTNRNDNIGFRVVRPAAPNPKPGHAKTATGGAPDKYGRPESVGYEQAHPRCRSPQGGGRTPPAHSGRPWCPKVWAGISL